MKPQLVAPLASAQRQRDGSRTLPIATAEMPRVLVVEDDSTLNRSIAWRMRAAGLRTLTAFDGRMGLSQAVKEDPDLVVLDLGLPGMNGLSVAKNLLSSLRSWDVPIVVITGDVSPNVEQFAREVGVAAVVRKPFELEALVDTVRRLLGCSA